MAHPLLVGRMPCRGKHSGRRGDLEAHRPLRLRQLPALLPRSPHPLPRRFPGFSPFPQHSLRLPRPRDRFRPRRRRPRVRPMQSVHAAGCMRRRESLPASGLARRWRPCDLLVRVPQERRPGQWQGGWVAPLPRGPLLEEVAPCGFGQGGCRDHAQGLARLRGQFGPARTGLNLRPARPELAHPKPARLERHGFCPRFVRRVRTKSPKKDGQAPALRSN